MGIEKPMDTNNSDIKGSVTATSKLKLVIFEIVVLFGAFNYLQLYADTVARYTGYPIATYGVPILIASLSAFILGKVIKLDRKRIIKLIVITALISIAPISIFMLVLNYSSGPF